MNHYMPTRLFTGPSCIEQHIDALRALGSSCVVITDATVSRLSGALDDVLHALDSGGIANAVWDGVTANPPISSCIEAGRFASESGAQFIVGVGGGSALDAAKAISVFASNPALDEEGFYALHWDQSPLPIALVGTTAGTGSEVTKVSVLTDGLGRKHSIHDDRLYSTVSFGDSRHTHSCPLAVTLSTGVDVLAHATESYFSRKADEISRACSVRAIRLASEPLAIAAAGGALSSDHRAQLYDASILGGLAINTTGTCFPHNVGYYLTENYGIPHGFASTAFLPAMLECVRNYDPAYAAGFYDAIGTNEKAFVSLVEACMPTLDIQMSKEEIGTALPRWENNGSVLNTRADIFVDTIREILFSMFVEH